MTEQVGVLRPAAQALIATALSDGGAGAWGRLAFLCDRIGPRLGGSASLDRAIAWAMDGMRADGLEDVAAEPVMVPHWVRGRESGALVSPEHRELSLLGLGGGVATSADGVEADVIVVADFDELDRRASEARGKIVCFNAPFTNYGATVKYRVNGAFAAAKLGAVACLVRSVGPTSLRTPHTGSVRYTDDAPRIPAAALSIEDAELLARMESRGETPRVRLTLEAQMRPDAPSANVIAQVRGRELPDEIVLIGAHLDSWDISPGAHDDGGGCVAVWEAARLLLQTGLRPRRTVRVCLFTNEENGLRGGNGYRDAHQGELGKHILAIESDAGVTAPTGFGLTGGGADSFATATKIVSLLESIGANTMSEGGGGADISPIGALGVPTMGLKVDMGFYWSIHHTTADTMEKVNPAELARCIAAIAVMAYSVAEVGLGQKETECRIGRL